MSDSKIKGRKNIHESSTNPVPVITQNPDNSQRNINLESSYSNDSSQSSTADVENKRPKTPPPTTAKTSSNEERELNSDDDGTEEDNASTKSATPEYEQQHRPTPTSETVTVPPIIEKIWFHKIISTLHLTKFRIPILLIVFACLFKVYNSNVERTALDQPHIFPEPEICKESFKQLKEAHPEQDSLVYSSLFHSASMVPKGNVSVLVLMYKNRNGQFFIEEMLKTTQKCIEKSNPIILNRTSFTREMEEDYGIALVDHGKSLKDSHIMLVNDIDSIPASVAPAFHELCDVHNPYVKPAIIFFTLKYNRLDDDSGDRTVTNVLRSKWSVLEDNVLDALITRVTDQVLVIR